MGKAVNSWSQLEAVLLAKVQNAMVKEGQFLKEKVEENYDKLITNAYTPTVYERTGQLKDSLFSKTPKVKNKTVEVEVKHDTDKIISSEPNQHYSVVDNYSRKDVSDWMPWIVMKGKSGDILGQGAWTEARDYMEKTKQDLESNGEHVDKLVQFLRQEGLNATKG